MKSGNRVRVLSINGKFVPGKKVDPAEDYWKLIGQIGTIQQDPNEKSIYAHFSSKPRVLVKFNKDLMMKYNLYSHNNIENSLWILVSDLEIIK